MMKNTICLNPKYSTTRRLVNEEDDTIRNFLPKNPNRKSEGGLRTQGYFKRSYTKKPLISIVTVVYNGEKFLEEAIESVINQEYDNIEYIVIDGASSDKSIEIIKKYEDQIDYWVSEPDEGQSDAFIKAFKLTSGDFVTWLNADDILLPCAINNLVKEINKDPAIRWYMGNTVHIDTENKIIKCRMGESSNRLLPKLGILNTYGPSTFFHKDLLSSVKGIDRNIHLRMDTDLWLQFYAIGARYKRLKNYTWAFRHHEDSKTMGNKQNKRGDVVDRGYKQYHKEVQYMCQKHKHCKNKFVRIIGIAILSLLRITSFNYIKGIVHTTVYKNKKYTELIKSTQCKEGTV